MDDKLRLMSPWQFAASLVLGVLSVFVPLVIFIGAVAACVYVARWWIDRPKT